MTLRDRIKGHGMTQADVARELGLSEPVLSQKLSGAVGWSLPQARALVELLRRYEPGVTLDDLFGTGAAA